MKYLLSVIFTLLLFTTSFCQGTTAYKSSTCSFRHDRFEIDHVNRLVLRSEKEIVITKFIGEGKSDLHLAVDNVVAKEYTPFKSIVNHYYCVDQNKIRHIVIFSVSANPKIMHVYTMADEFTIGFASLFCDLLPN